MFFDGIYVTYICACFVHVYNTIAHLYIFLFGPLLHIGGVLSCTCIVYGMCKFTQLGVNYILFTLIQACSGIL